MTTTRISRNGLCYCGSGKKFKKCCLLRENADPWRVMRDVAQAERTVQSKESQPVPNPQLTPPGRLRQGEPHTIEGTREHPFYVYGKGWTPMSQLSPGDWLRTDNGWVEVEEVRDTGEIKKVYNLRVADYHTYFVGTPEWGFGVWAHNTCFEVRGLPDGRFGLFEADGRAVLFEGRPIAANSVEGVVLLATDARGIDVSAISRVVRTTGTDVNGPFTRLDIGSGERALETTLRGTTLEVDWISGPYAIFNLREVQTAAGGPGSLRRISGYVTDELAVNVRQPGYLQRFAEAVGARLGGQWTARLEPRGNKTYMILDRAP